MNDHPLIVAPYFVAPAIGVAHVVGAGAGLLVLIALGTMAAGFLGSALRPTATDDLMRPVIAKGHVSLPTLGLTAGLAFLSPVVGVAVAGLLAGAWLAKALGANRGVRVVARGLWNEALQGDFRGIWQRNRNLEQLWERRALVRSSAQEWRDGCHLFSGLRTEIERRGPLVPLERTWRTRRVCAEPVTASG